MEDEPISPELQEAFYLNALDERFVIGFIVGMLTAGAVILIPMYWPQISTLTANLF